ncbi:MAG: DNA helicase RecQ [Spirochaetaceae bacterium]|nr:DNA helicase RecQ [Spirochaetaceae bacterium]
MDRYAILSRYFGYKRFREGQEEVIGAILEGRDTLAVMPTGAGKSICYQIPAMMLEGLTIVISPLISLMKDQVNALTGAGIPAACLNSSLAPEEYSETVFNAKNGLYKLLYIAPERLQREDMRRLAGALSVNLVVVDEAHCVSHWGHDFRPSYLLIPEFIEAFSPRPVTAAFTATATGAVRGDIMRHLNLRSPFTLVTGFNRENLYFEVQKPANKMNALLELLSERKSKNESGIIYCATRKAVEEVCDTLCGRGFNVTRYHAGLDDRERRENQDDFIFDRKPLIVATNAFGMGIDKSNVSFVIHYNMPKNIESYYQEAGRAGRDGGKADCILLYSPRDVHINEFLIKQSQENEGAGDYADQRQIEHNLEMLKQMTFYATGNECLRGRMRSYFGESAPAFCGNCSNCNTEFESIDISIDAQKIVSCVYRMKQQGRDFGKTMIINVLRGSKNEKIKSLRLDALSTYGIMPDVPQQRVRAIIDYLLEEGYLASAGDEYPVVQLCERSREIIGDKKTLKMMLPKEKPKRELRFKTEAAGESTGGFDIDEALFLKLKELRRRFAEEAGGVPAYIIFSDATLRDMCRKLPRNEAEFLNVSGVGEIKSKKFGAPFLKLITEHTRER